MTRALLRIYPFAVGGWALAVVLFAKPLAPRSVIGGALVLGGLAFAAWAAGYRRTGQPAAEGEAGDTLFAGPYGWVRNPSQLGTTFVGLGLTLWSGAFWPWLPVATAVLSVSILTVAQYAKDEAAERRLGWDYRAYRATVPIWVPRFAPRPWLGGGRWRPGPALKSNAPLMCGVALIAIASLVWGRAGGVHIPR